MAEVDKAKLKNFFHSVFNKINNISFVAASTKMMLQEEIVNKPAADELKKQTSQMIEVLSRIEENAILLDKSLREYYESAKKQNLPISE